MPPNPPSGWLKALSYILSALQIVMGVVAIVFSFGTAAPVAIFSIINGVMSIVGGVAGIVALASTDPEVVRIVSMISGGVGALGSGAEAMLVGGRMIATGGIGGKIVGGIFFLIGIITVTFGVNEIVFAFTGYNALKEWMGEDVYNGLYMGFTIAATIASIVGNVYLRSLAKQGKAVSEETKQLIRATQDADDVYGGVSQRLIENAAKEKDYVRFTELLNERVSNIADDVLKQFPNKSARWRGSEINKRMEYTLGALKEQPLGSFGRADAIEDIMNAVLELKPRTAWSMAKGWSQLDGYALGAAQQNLLDDTKEIIKILITYKT